MKNPKPTIIIIGAGVTGLMAAKRLCWRFKIILLEANDRLGGRVNTLHPPGFTKAIEAGAEFVHGKLPLTMKLLEKTGIEYEALRGKFYSAGKSGFHTQHEMFNGWDKLLKRMKKEKHDLTLYEFMQKHYPGEENTGFRVHIQNYAEGFDGADITKASMKALYKEWSNEEKEIYRVPDGYI